MLQSVRNLTRFSWGFLGYLHDPIPASDCKRILEQRIANRERYFLQLLKRGVCEAGVYITLARTVFDRVSTDKSIARLTLE